MHARRAIAQERLSSDVYLIQTVHADVAEAIDNFLGVELAADENDEGTAIEFYEEGIDKLKVSAANLVKASKSFKGGGAGRALKEIVLTLQRVSQEATKIKPRAGFISNERVMDAVHGFAERLKNIPASLTKLMR